MRRILSMVLILFLDCTVYAEGLQAIHHQTITQGDALNKSSYQAIQRFDPTATFDHYSENVSQTNYYQGVTKSNTTRLTQDAIAARDITEVSNTISASMSHHPNFVVSPNDPDIKHAQLIQNHADAIIQGVTDRYVDCKAPLICKTAYQTKICEETAQRIDPMCKRTLTIEIIPHETTTHTTLVALINTRYHHYAGVSSNAVSGHVNFLGPHDTSYHLEGLLDQGIDCHSLQGSVTSLNTNNRGTQLDYIHFPSCDNGMTLDFHLSGPKTINTRLEIDIALKVVTYEVKDKWVHSCKGLLHDSSCTFKSKSCTQLQSTKLFQTIPVTRACWEEQYQYLCHNGHGAGDCASLQNEGCEQIGSTCKESDEHGCTRYQQTYQCPLKSCSSSANIACLDGKTYCLEGNCRDPSYKTNQEFSQSVSALSALADASKQLDPHSYTIFAGHPTHCSEKPIGFSNCCSEKGWGQDAGLAHCSVDAKKLHEARLKGVAIKVGRYCSGSKPFPCSEHAQVFCVFNSRLAKIIQEQGRFGQLHLPFGSAKSPNCLGITIDQLRSIDLSKVDFHEFYGDIQAKTPDLEQIQKKIQQETHAFKEAGQIND